MYISRLVIRGFRNLHHLDVTFQKGVTCIVGENNTGKSNLLYAMRLAVDASLASFWRQLSMEDLPVGTDIRTPKQVVVSLEFRDFADKANEDAMLFGYTVNGDIARITYRFRPRRDIREAIAAESNPGDNLSLEDYRWEICGGGQIDPAVVEWTEDLGSWVKFDELQQSYLVVFMEPLRDVEQRLKQSRFSPLGRLLTPTDIPLPEQETLVEILSEANEKIAESVTIKKVGKGISDTFAATAGKAYKMDVALGALPATFGDVARGLGVLLSNDFMKDFDPSRNGLGLNNVLYISMLLKYFEKRVEEAKTAGQILLIEEPEAHLHPQLQRVLFKSLQAKAFQTILTTHSTYITSQAALASLVVLTNDGSAASAATVPVADVPLSEPEVQDLERYLDATKSLLLYARRVMLVEGPAELFLIPPLVKKIMGINLDEHGISVIPIYGVHFAAYAKLFGPSGMTKKCAIVGDADLTPSDAAELDAEEDDDVVAAADLSGIENDYVKAFLGATTFEREATHRGTLEMFAKAATDLGAGTIAVQLRRTLTSLPASGPLNPTQTAALETARKKVLRTAKRYGKARFAQVASKYASEATWIPSYVKEAVEWLIS